jgi:TRAP-type C4-dicarboxylate transport system substrate-binding protein
VKKLFFISLAIILVLGLVLVGCASSTPAPKTTAPTSAPAATQAAPVKPIELKVANFQPDVHPSNEMLRNWAKTIETETGGKVKFTIYPGETLAKSAVTYDAVVEGTADMCWTLAGYSPGRFDLSEVVAFPLLGMKNTEVGSNILWDLWETFPEMRAQYKDTHVLWLSCPVSKQLFSMKPAPHVEDMKGLKIRVAAAWTSALELLGGVPVSMGGPEVYEGLQRGVLDGDLHPWEAAVNYRWYEVVKYVTITDMGPDSVFIATMNSNTYNKLTDDVKKVIDKYSGRYGSVEVSAKGMWDKTDQGYYNFIKEKSKIQFFTWTPEDRAKAIEMTMPFRKNWIAKQEAKGLPGQKVADELVKVVEKYK